MRKMNFKIEENKISLYNEESIEMGYVEFPYKDNLTVLITTTVVSKQFQGSGIGGRLLEELALELRKRNLKAYPICSYAKHWFSKHQEYDDIICPYTSAG